MPAHVTVRFTVNEAATLAACADMELQDSFGGDHDRALRRAVEKLNRAIAHGHSTFRVNEAT